MGLARLLLAEDDAVLRGIVEGLLSEPGHRVTCAADGLLALECFERARELGEPFDLVISDINMPRLDGLELIDRLRSLDADIPVIFVTAYSSVDTAVAALRKGAWDYLTKPFRNDQLLQVVSHALNERRLKAENTRLRRAVRKAYGFGEIVGRSPGLRGVLNIVEKAAPTAASVLIRGETGTGKELIARAIHEASPRAAGPFLAVNCGALPEGLLESELFGHEKGAFSGAVASSKGLFRTAHGGTLFLDELGEMPAALQVKLLRVLESREVRPVGASRAVPIDVRLVAATNRELMDEVEQGRFREDLYYRFAVIELELPPLRRRPDDVLPLCWHFIARLAEERGEPPRTLGPQAEELLQCYPWPGNVRELRNAIEHAVTLGESQIEVADLPARLRRGGARRVGGLDIPLDMTLAELEQRQVLRVLDELGGDRKQAATQLGIDLSTLYRKLKRWEAEGEAEGEAVSVSVV